MRTKTYFASDMHFGSDIIENSHDAERRFVRWLDTIKEDAAALYLLGDVFDFWFEYKEVVPRGFTRFLGKIAEMSDAGIKIHFLTGNHDIWVTDYLSHETGMIVHRKPLYTTINGKNFYLAHGDGLGDTSLSFRLIRGVFHNKLCQFLFRMIHPRWGVGLGYAWSKHSRKKKAYCPAPYFGENKEHLVLYAKEYIKEHPDTNYLIFGHRHILLDLMLSAKSRVIIVGDWLQDFSYAVFDGEELVLENFDS